MAPGERCLEWHMKFRKIKKEEKVNIVLAMYFSVLKNYVSGIQLIDTY